MRSLLVIAALCCAAGAAQAYEPVAGASRRAAEPAAPVFAVPTLFAAPEASARERGTGRATCSGDAALCYDGAERRVVFRGARRYMPQIDGLRAESVSLRRDRIVFKYSF